MGERNKKRSEMKKTKSALWRRQTKMINLFTISGNGMGENWRRNHWYITNIPLFIVLECLTMSVIEPAHRCSLTLSLSQEDEERKRQMSMCLWVLNKKKKTLARVTIVLLNDLHISLSWSIIEVLLHTQICVRVCTLTEIYAENYVFVSSIKTFSI